MYSQYCLSSKINLWCGAQVKNENDENDMLPVAKKKETSHEAVDPGDEIRNLPATQRETDDDPPQILVYHWFSYSF